MLRCPVLVRLDRRVSWPDLLTSGSKNFNLDEPCPSDRFNPKLAAEACSAALLKNRVEKRSLRPRLLLGAAREHPAQTNPL